MHPVVEDGVIADGRGSKQEDREQDPSNGITRPSCRQQSTHRYRRYHADRGSYPVGQLPPGPSEPVMLSSGTLAKSRPRVNTPNATAATGATRCNLKIVITGMPAPPPTRPE